MASFDLLKESFNWSKGRSFRWMNASPPKEDDLKIKSWVQTKYKRFYNQQLNLWKNPSAWPHLSSPPFFSTNFDYLYTSFSTKQWKKQENLRLFPRWHACHQCHSKVGSGATFVAARWILWRSQGSTSCIDQEIGVIPRLVFLHFKKREAYLDIWSWGGMIWWEKSRNWKQTRCEIQSFQTIDSWIFFCWVLAVPFPNSPMTWDVHNLMQPKKPSRFHGSTDPTPAAGAIAHLVQHMDPEVLHVDSWRIGVGFWSFLPLEEGEITWPMVMLHWVYWFVLLVFCELINPIFKKPLGWIWLLFHVFLNPTDALDEWHVSAIRIHTPFHFWDLCHFSRLPEVKGAKSL